MVRVSRLPARFMCDLLMRLTGIGHSLYDVLELNAREADDVVSCIASPYIDYIMVALNGIRCDLELGEWFPQKTRHVSIANTWFQTMRDAEEAIGFTSATHSRLAETIHSHTDDDDCTDGSDDDDGSDTASVHTTATEATEPLECTLVELMMSLNQPVSTT